MTTPDTLQEKLGKILVAIDEAAHFEASTEDYDDYYSTPEDFKDDIAQILQAFKSEGYLSPQIAKLRAVTYANEQLQPFVDALNRHTQELVDGKVMTGQEFYDRFMDGLMSIENENVRNHVISNAQRAAGIDTVGGK